MPARHETFTADATAWVRATEKRFQAVARESVQRVMSRSQRYLSGEMVKVQTGFLRASLAASSSPGLPLKGNDGKSVTYNGGSISLVLLMHDMRKPLYMLYTANYAAAVHNGTSRMVGRPWVSVSAVQWPAIVRQVTLEARARAGDV